jgi:hypothetical protein
VDEMSLNNLDFRRKGWSHPDLIYEQSNRLTSIKNLSVIVAISQLRVVGIQII